MPAQCLLCSLLLSTLVYVTNLLLHVLASYDDIDYLELHVCTYAGSSGWQAMTILGIN